MAAVAFRGRAVTPLWGEGTFHRGQKPTEEGRPRRLRTAIPESVPAVTRADRGLGRAG